MYGSVRSDWLVGPFQKIVATDSTERQYLILKSPHIFSHIFSCHPVSVPIEKKYVTAVSMSSPCDPSASGYGLNVRAGQMFRLEDVTSSSTSVSRQFDYGPPPSVLVVGKVDYGCRAATFGKLASPAWNTFPGPAVDDIANSLFFVWIAGTAKYLDVTIIIIDGLLCQIRHKELEPGLCISSPFRRAWDVQIPVQSI